MVYFPVNYMLLSFGQKRSNIAILFNIDRHCYGQMVAYPSGPSRPRPGPERLEGGVGAVPGKEKGRVKDFHSRTLQSAAKHKHIYHLPAPCVVNGPLSPIVQRLGEIIQAFPGHFRGLSVRHVVEVPHYQQRGLFLQGISPVEHALHHPYPFHLGTSAPVF